MSSPQESLACPRCAGQRLATAMTKQGVEVDHCPSCGGIWLDKGEIYYFTRSAKLLVQELQRAQKAARPGELKSPANGTPMQRLQVFGVEIDMCTDTGGIWLDRGEIQQVVAAADAGLCLAVDDSPTRSTVRRTADGAIAAADLVAYAAAAKPIPNLFVRSVSLLVVLYALLGGLLILAVEAGKLEAGMAVVIGVVVVTGQFLLGPFIMDLSLGWFYDATWLGPDELPEHLRTFIMRVCGERGMRFPRLGLIHDCRELEKFNLDEDFLRGLNPHQPFEKTFVRVHVDQAFVDPHFPTIPCMCPFAAWALSRRDPKPLSRERNGPAQFHTRAVGDLHDLAANAVQALRVSA